MRHRETCDNCGFDADDYTDRLDVLGTLRAFERMWAWSVEGVEESTLQQRPEPDVWSAAEYASHSGEVVANMGRLVHALLTTDDLRIDGVGDSVPEPATHPDTATAIATLGSNVARLLAKVQPLDESGWARRGHLDGDEVTVESVVIHAIHDCTHHLRDIGRGLHSLGAGAPSQRGTLVAVNASNGGVPKTPMLSAEIGRRGVLGDRQAARQHHGRPLQALSLWSQDVIDALKGEGHPIESGAAGENLTVSGIEWSTLRPGVRVLVGEVLCEISAYAQPCQKNAQWFADRNFNRIAHEQHPGWSRAYAWVLEGGTVTPGDDVLVEP